MKEIKFNLTNYSKLVYFADKEVSPAKVESADKSKSIKDTIDAKQELKQKYTEWQTDDGICKQLNINKDELENLKKQNPYLKELIDKLQNDITGAKNSADSISDELIKTLKTDDVKQIELYKSRLKEYKAKLEEIVDEKKGLPPNIKLIVAKEKKFNELDESVEESIKKWTENTKFAKFIESKGSDEVEQIFKNIIASYKLQPEYLEFQTNISKSKSPEEVTGLDVKSFIRNNQNDVEGNIIEKYMDFIENVNVDKIDAAVDYSNRVINIKGLPDSFIPLSFHSYKPALLKWSSENLSSGSSALDSFSPADALKNMGADYKNEMRNAISSELMHTSYRVPKFAADKITDKLMQAVDTNMLIQNVIQNAENITCVGYASCEGNFDYNVKLAKDRAAAMRDKFLTSFDSNPALKNTLKSKIVLDGKVLGLKGKPLNSAAESLNVDKEIYEEWQKTSEGMHTEFTLDDIKKYINSYLKGEWQPGSNNPNKPPFGLGVLIESTYGSARKADLTIEPSETVWNIKSVPEIPKAEPKMQIAEKK